MSINVFKMYFITTQRATRGSIQLGLCVEFELKGTYRMILQYDQG